MTSTTEPTAAPLETVAAIDTELARLQARHEALEAEGSVLSGRIVTAEAELARATVADDIDRQDALQLEIERARTRLRAIDAGKMLLTSQAGELTAERSGKSLAEAEAAYAKAVQDAVAATEAWEQRFATFLETDFATYGEAAQAAGDKARRLNRAMARAGGSEVLYETAADRAWKRFPGLGEITFILGNVRAAQLKRQAEAAATMLGGL